VVTPSPTCLYRASTDRSGLRLVTISVGGHYALVALKQGHGKIIAELGRRRASCVQFGGSRMLVPLDHGTVLDVRGACQLAARFAAKAIPRLGA
jgi:hypothetical protein